MHVRCISHLSNLNNHKFSNLWFLINLKNVAKATELLYNMCKHKFRTTISYEDTQVWPNADMEILGLFENFQRGIFLRYAPAWEQNVYMHDYATCWCFRQFKEKKSTFFRWHVYNFSIVISIFLLKNWREISQNNVFSGIFMH